MEDRAYLPLYLPGRARQLSNRLPAMRPPQSLTSSSRQNPPPAHVPIRPQSEVIVIDSSDDDDDDEIQLLPVPPSGTLFKSGTKRPRPGKKLSFPTTARLFGTLPPPPPLPIFRTFNPYCPNVRSNSEKSDDPILLTESYLPTPPSSALPTPPSSATPPALTYLLDTTTPSELASLSIRPPSPDFPCSYPLPPVPPPSTASTSSTSGPRKCAVVDVNGRGKGLVLTRSVSRGEIIIAEAPFFQLSFPLEVYNVYKTYRKLGPEKRELFLSFPIGAGDDVLVSRARTSVIPLEDHREDYETSSDADTDPCGLFEHISRVNHSCAPNAVWTWNADEGLLYLRAWKDLKNGTEITCAYNDQICIESSSLRRAYFEENFQFTCSCTACSRPTHHLKKSDTRLARLREILSLWDRRIGDLGRHPFLKGQREEAIAIQEEAINILSEEKLFHHLGEAYKDLMEIHTLWGDIGGSQSAAEGWEKCLEGVLGRGKAEIIVEQVFLDPKKVTDWGLFSEPAKGKRRK
ncbi:hypothetical protein TREMEDRAFT_60660 [Tremella mesenterica DSM 1558]|uniref:uncharacterized protein n=1 Tax=Tremella mesenterica (strain ATCC 24925 / CBS 8224 / DSM 1558 / NBRC 9311 / NRRL Y-6157 / RJB 2259-6 / UBC 559-6) TaxID=578456 RepID=UPI0003F49554|nr:uncharacterized protein TREMEDRAFT_60660 [Tremella mesenterica DSM 1558]EIW71746.1 hypothetical protein TREMEDRAFT_60660 [Tremella mesenterica DSM 1558]